MKASELLSIWRRLRNMPARRVLLITYDVSDDDKRIELLDEIWALGTCRRLSESSYAVKTTLRVGFIWKKLKPIIDDDDNLYVIRLRRPVIGQGSPNHLQWLRSNLSPSRRRPLAPG